MFLSLSAAQEFQQQFKLPTDHLHLIGVGLPQALSTAFANARRHQRTDDSESGEHLEQISGTAMLINRQNRLAANGQALGFEIVSYWNELAHSWLCAGLENEMNRLFDIRPNAQGLVPTEQQAMQVYEWIAEDKQQGYRAEPEPYFPWLIVEYPLETA